MYFIMKKLFFVLFVAMALQSMVSCTEETVSGIMPYSKDFEFVETFTSFTNESVAAEQLYDEVMQDILALKTEYGKKWDVEYSGSSLDEALAAEDENALADFDQAVASMMSLKESFDADIAAGDYGKGSFTVTVQYVVKRDMVLKSSEEVTFKYPM